MRFCNNDHDVIYDSISKATRYASKIENADISDMDAVRELRYMAEDLLNSLENIEIIEED